MACGEEGREMEAMNETQNMRKACEQNVKKTDNSRHAHVDRSGLSDLNVDTPPQR